MARYFPFPSRTARVSPLVERAPFGVEKNPETWLHRSVAYLEGDDESPIYYSMEEAEMSMLKNAHALLAGLHVIEQVTDAVAARHAKGEHFTVGDFANLIAKEAPIAVKEAGIEDHPWKPAPPKRGGPRKPTNNGDTSQ